MQAESRIFPELNAPCCTSRNLRRLTIHENPYGERGGIRHQIQVRRVNQAALGSDIIMNFNVCGIPDFTVSGHFFAELFDHGPGGFAVRTLEFKAVSPDVQEIQHIIAGKKGIREFQDVVRMMGGRVPEQPVLRQREAAGRLCGAGVDDAESVESFQNVIVPGSHRVGHAAHGVAAETFQIPAVFQHFGGDYIPGTETDV